VVLLPEAVASWSKAARLSLLALWITISLGLESLEFESAVGFSRAASAATWCKSRAHTHERRRYEMRLVVVNPTLGREEQQLASYLV